MNTSEDALRVDERTVDVGGAEAAEGVIEMGIGSLDVRGGAEPLLDAKFTYDDPNLEPELSYDVEADKGHLKIGHPGLKRLNLKSPDSRWDLHFNNAIPLGLRLRIGSGDTTLGLGALNLTQLDVQVGSGNINADLNGSPAQLDEVKLNTASGYLALQMVGKYPALRRVGLGTASGKQDLALAGDFPALQKLKFASASGAINLALSGRYDTLKKLVVNTASGAINLDLTGTMRRDLDVEISCVSGKVLVRVPTGLGVKLAHTSVSGKVTAPGFHRENGHYVNAAYGKSEITLSVRISSVSSRVEVQLIEA